MSQAVHAMFSDIAPRYDLTNSVLSLGIHHLWRKRTVKVSGAKPGSSVLDCATGTGDLALEFKRTVGPTGKVLGTDFNATKCINNSSETCKVNFDVMINT